MSELVENNPKANPQIDSEGRGVFILSMATHVAKI